MSSRAGPQVVGSDGRDFQHRERVADHYKVRLVRVQSVQKRCTCRLTRPASSAGSCDQPTVLTVLFITRMCLGCILPN